MRFRLKGFGGSMRADHGGRMDGCNLILRARVSSKSVDTFLFRFLTFHLVFCALPPTQRIFEREEAKDTGHNTIEIGRLCIQCSKQLITLENLIAVLSWRCASLGLCAAGSVSEFHYIGDQNT